MKIQNNNKFSYSKLEIIIAITIFYANITYLPNLTKNSIVPMFNYALWIILFFAITKLALVIYKELYSYLISLFLFDIFILIMEIVTNNSYIKSSLLYPVNMSIIILIMGVGIGKFITSKSYVLYIKTYVYSCLIIGVIIYFQYFIGVDWINSMDFILNQKNGIAQLFLIAIVFLMLTDGVFHRKSKILITSFCCLMLIMVKSRAVLVGLGLIFIYYFLKSNLKKKYFIILVGSIIIGYLAISTDFISYLIYNVMLNNRTSMGVDAIASGRLNHLNIFIELFGNHPLIGNGAFYLEAFPLASLMSYGIIGSIPLFALWILPAFTILGYKDDYCVIKLRNIAFAIWCITFINGFFEELAPFGPGVKCYMLWLLTGIYIGYMNKCKKDLQQLE